MHPLSGPLSTFPPPIVAHRGACGHAPENTLASIRKAAELGATWVEFDVHLSRDGVPILLHDDTLDRTTDGHGPVAKVDWEDLKELDAGSWWGNAYSGESLPDLGSAIDLLGELELGAVIEMKPSPRRDTETGRLIAEQVKADWPDHLPPPLLSSFRQEALRAAQLAAPEFDRAFLVTGIPEDWQDQMWALECTSLHCDHSPLTPERVGEILSEGYAIRCYTVNDPARAQKLLHWGVQAVLTDFPDRLLEAEAA